MSCTYEGCQMGTGGHYLKPLGTDLHLRMFQGLHMNDLPIAQLHHLLLWSSALSCHCALEKCKF